MSGATLTQPATRGGYQAPRRPAPASGPGRLSRRTDGGPGDPRQPIRDIPNADYGEQKLYRQQQAGAPMSRAPQQAEGPPVNPVDLSGVTPLNAPSQRPNEPITAGAATGAGPGSEALGLTAGDDPSVRSLRNNLRSFELMANMPQASPQFRAWVRQLRGVL